MRIRKGFTAIEIVIVLAIVAIIGGIYYVSKNKSSADVVTNIDGSNGFDGPINGLWSEKSLTVQPLNNVSGFNLYSFVVLRGSDMRMVLNKNHKVNFDLYKMGTDKKWQLINSSGYIDSMAGGGSGAFRYSYQNGINNADTYGMVARAKDISTGEVVTISGTISYGGGRSYYTYAMASDKIRSMDRNGDKISIVYNYGLPAKASLTMYPETISGDSDIKVVDLTGKTTYDLPQGFRGTTALNVKNDMGLTIDEALRYKSN